MVVKSMGYEVWNAPEIPEPQKLPGLYFPLYRLLATDPYKFLVNNPYITG